MRVDDTFSASTDLRSLQVERSPQTEVQGTRAPKTGDRTGDSAALSSVGVELSRALAGESPERTAQVEKAQKAYEAGDFSVPAGETADALITSALAETSIDKGLEAAAG